MKRSRALIPAVAALAIFGSIGLVPNVAQASNERDPVEMIQAEASAEDLALAAADPAMREEREDAIDEYLDAQAREGRLIDASTVNAAIVEAEGVDVGVVWQDGVEVGQLVASIPEVLVADEQVTEGVSVETAIPPMEFGVESAVVDESELADNPAATGLGLEVTSKLQGGDRISGTCVTTTISSNVSNSCFAKYRSRYSSANYDYFYYERWATGTGQQRSNAYDYSPAIIDIRSRPWAGTTNVKQLNDYWPRGGSTGCTGSGTAGFSAAGITMNVPVQDCKSKTPIPNATSKTMGVILDQGLWVDGRSKTVSFGMSLGAAKKTVPNMADYTYMKFCVSKLACNSFPIVGNLRKDSGW